MFDNFIKGCVVAGACTTLLALGLSYHNHTKADNIPVYQPAAGTPVHYNWGWGRPASNIPADHFNAVFNQSRSDFKAGDYFVQTFADDGVKVIADGTSLINRWSDYNGKMDRALWTNVTAGKHQVTTQYYENVALAGVFSDIVPFGSWLAYYYPNQNLDGMPTAAKVIAPGASGKLSQDFGWGSPAAGISADHFSASYTTAKRITAGDYILRARADDGIRVYVDGKLQIDGWGDGGYRENAVKLSISDNPNAKTGQKDVHWIEVQYYDLVASGKLDVDLEKFSSEFANSWVGEIFPNEGLSGTAAIIGGASALNPISNINFDWGWGNGSPLPSIPGDGFSARFTKKVNLTAGTYEFTANGDDGVRVKLDGQTIINAWPNAGFQDQKKIMAVNGGQHTITVEYFENVGLAKLSFDYRLYTQLPVQVTQSVHKNWGWGSPGNGAPADYFTADFDQSGNYASGDYFVQAFADDGVKVEADHQTLINRWGDYNGKIDRALWLGVTNGQHTVKTHYLENVASAAIFSDVVPFDSWLAYYYPNQNLDGMPEAASVIKPGPSGNLSQDFGWGAPAAGISADHFSARYTTAKHIAAGDYILRAKADDGVRVYVDGKLQINGWGDGGYRENSVKLSISNNPNAKTGEADVHWIEVQYYDSVATGKVDVELDPFASETVNSWVGEVFPTQDLSGTPYIIGGVNSITPVTNINYNWGSNSPLPNVPADHFSERFTKKVNLDTGTYLFVANADDGVRVRLDDQLVINDWPNSGNNEDRKPLFITGGNHTITVEYYDDTARANLSFNLLKLSSKNVYYERTGEVQHNWGMGGPDSFPTDGFEAAFDQSGYYSAGDYFLQTFADDGVNVDVNGHSLINRWTGYTGKADRALWTGVQDGFYNIFTHYYDNVYSAAVFSNVVRFDYWLAYYFPNETLSGMPSASKVIPPNGQGFTEDFQTSGPANGMASDHFSARYTTAKRLSAGTYILKAGADDGVRVYVDGKLVLDRWTNGTYNEDFARVQIVDQTNAPQGQQDVHWVDVEYHDTTSVGKVTFALTAASQPVYISTTYGSFTKTVDAQMTVKPQTDLYTKYVTSDALTLDSSGNWIVAGTGSNAVNVYSGPNTGNSIVGTLNGGTKVSVVKMIANPGQPTWYQISGWMNALRGDVQSYLNPASFAKGSNEYLQFLKLSTPAGLNADEVNQKILKGKGTLEGQANAFIQAANQYNVNEIYLISHSLLETGQGYSPLAQGITVSSVDGQPVVPRVVYNMYGINAFDSCAEQCGSEYAYKQGWFTPEAAIIGGAQFIGQNYISKGQDTLYKMRWNPAAPATHQYASDIGWAIKQVDSIKSLYDQLSNYTLIFDVPSYQ